MGYFSCNRLDSFDLAFLDQLTDLYSAELLLLPVLPEMAEAASDAKLRTELRARAREAHIHARRLAKVFLSLNLQPVNVACRTMECLIALAQKVMRASGSADVIDISLIAAAQRIAHYQMAAYAAARNFAQRLGRPEIAQFLQSTLQEEKTGNRILSGIADRLIIEQCDFDLVGTMKAQA